MFRRHREKRSDCTLFGHEKPGVQMLSSPTTRRAPPPSAAICVCSRATWSEPAAAHEPADGGVATVVGAGSVVLGVAVATEDGAVGPEVVPVEAEGTLGAAHAATIQDSAGTMSRARRRRSLDRVGVRIWALEVKRISR